MLKNGSVKLAAGALVLAALLAMGYRSWQRSSAADPACCISESPGRHIVMDPMLFSGQVREAYKVAQENPALFSRLHCYCGCDKQEGHTSLLDCFRTKHGSACEICVGEALEAKKLAEEGTPVEQIRDALRARYARGS
jgi:Protein of unknown function with PCYCGC motif